MSFLDILETVSIFSIGATILSLPLLMFKRLRPFIGLGITILTYLWGFILWLVAFGFVLSNWGWIPVIIGLVLAGVGIVPVAMFMALIHGDFANFFFFLIAIFLLIGARYLGQRLTGIYPSE